MFARLFAPRAAGRPAVVGADGGLDRAELLDRAARLAARLRADGSPVLVYGHKQPAVVVAFVAALRRGRPYVPLDSSTPPGRAARIVATAQPGDAVLAEEPPRALARELGARGVSVVSLDALAAAVAGPGGPPAPAPQAPRVPAPEAPAYVLFTSGTTGDPKGVPISYRALGHFTGWLLATHAFVPDGETFLNQAPFSFDLSVMDLYGALLTGGTLFTIGRDEVADPRRLFRRLDGAPLTAWVSTPSFARFCLAEPRFAQAMLPALRRFLFCGETLPPRVVRELLARFTHAEVWNMYGPTEATVAVTAVRIDTARAAAEQPLPVGRPAPGTEVWIADVAEPSRRLPAGAQGEIVIAGPQVASGYLPPPQGAPSAAEPSPFFALSDGRRAYRTGDLGTIDQAEGLLWCAGRLDRQIKLHGYRIELEEIEARLRAVPGVRDGAVLAVERDGRADHLVAFVVGAADGPPLPADGRALTRHVRAALAEWLGDHALPRLVRGVDTLPLTANGKVDRAALREMLR
ncbi:MAG TPA: amino acid adenylation domain-containing protein [Candidatus Binatia bacterium]|nr:amino acid adenylation domain-containing protein [Candidatus Binatia bacterium]